jgi:hypothetical protein
VKGQDLIDKLARQMQPPAPTAAQTNGHASGTAAPPYIGSAASAADETIIEKCRAAGNAPKFEALFDRGEVRRGRMGRTAALRNGFQNELRRSPISGSSSPPAHFPSLASGTFYRMLALPSGIRIARVFGFWLEILSLTPELLLKCATKRA